LGVGHTHSSSISGQTSSLPDDTPPDRLHGQISRRASVSALALAARRAELAGLVALLASALVAAVLDRPPPLEPLAALVMEWTPVPIANWLLDVLGPVGKPLALYGAAALALAVTGLLGRLAVSSWLGRAGLVMALGLSLALTWLLLRPGAWPGLLALVGGFWAAFWLLGSSRRAARQSTPPPADSERAQSERRRALLAAGLNAGALAAVSLLPVAASRLRLRMLGRSVHPPLFAYRPPDPRRPGFSRAGLTPRSHRCPRSTS
jgi:hypothetical protein